MFHDQRRECRRGRLARRQHASLSKPPSPIVDLPARRSVLARNLGHLGTEQQTLGDDPSSLSFRTHAAPRRSFKNFQPAHRPRRWAVEMDVLFAVQSHPKPPSKPEASSHSYPYPEARVPAKRLHRSGVAAKFGGYPRCANSLSGETDQSSDLLVSPLLWLRCFHGVR